jgi:hypothetical protein
MLESGWTLPKVFGKTRSSPPFGQESFHSRSVSSTAGDIGISRWPADDFGMPTAPHSSARWRTVIVRLSKSTTLHGRPRNSEARGPVKIAVKISGRYGSDIKKLEVGIVPRSSASTAARANHTWCRP